MSEKKAFNRFIFILLGAFALSVISFRSYAHSFLRTPALPIATEQSGVLIPFSEIAAEVPESTAIVGKPSLAADGRRMLLVLRPTNGPAYLGLFEEGIGIKPVKLLNQEVQEGAVISNDGMRAAFLAEESSSDKTSPTRRSLYLLEDGFPPRIISKQTFAGKWQLVFSPQANRLIVSPNDSAAEYFGELSSENKTASSQSQKYQGIIAIDFLPRLPASSQHENSSPMAQSPFEIKALRSVPGAIWEAAADGSLIRTLTLDDAQRKIQLTSFKSLRKPMTIDIDHDGGSDLLLFQRQPELPVWTAYTLGGSDGTMPVPASREGMLMTWRVGDPNGIPVPADYNGDGVLDFATFSPNVHHEQSTTYANWQLVLSKPPSTLRGMQPESASHSEIFWGTSSALPVPSDYDGDGAADIAVFESELARWKILYSSGGFQAAKGSIEMDGYGRIINFGNPGDYPVPADYDGNGQSDFALFDEGNGPGAIAKWKVRYRGKIRDGQSRTETIEFGKFGDIPVPADYDGNGSIDIAVFRPHDGTWLIHQENGSQRLVEFDLSKDEPQPIYPVPADYDADGKADFAFYVPAGYFKWRILPSRFQDDARFRMPNSIRVITTMNLGGPGFLPPAIWLRNFYLSALKKVQASAENKSR